MSSLNRYGFSPQFLRAIVVTVLLVAIYRLGLQIQLPFINAALLQQDDLINVIIGSQFSTSILFSIFSLGLMPYVSAYLLVEIFSLFVPPLKKLRGGDFSGRMKLKRLALFITLVLGALQGAGLVKGISDMTLVSGMKVLNADHLFEYVLIVCIFVGGVYLLIVLAELISRFGIGNGISIIIFSGICAEYFQNLNLSISNRYEVGLLTYPLVIFILGVLGLSAVVLFRTKISIPVTRVDAGKSIAIFQFNLCPSGNAAISYANSLIMLPVTILSFFESGHRFFDWFHPNTWIYNIFLVLFIFGFSYLFAWLFLHPQRRIARMMDRGWQFADPDTVTEKYLLRKVFVYTLPWTFFLCALAIIPSTLIASANVPFYIGGASLYIAIAIVMDVLDRYRLHRKTQSGELVKIAEFHDVYDAGMIKKHIEAEGIRPHLQGYYHRQLYYFFGPYIDISLMVAKKDVEFCEDLLLKYYDGLGLMRTQAANSA